MIHIPASKKISYLDRWARGLVQERPGPCLACHTIKDGYDTCHIISRKINATRWLMGNLLKMCNRCHRVFTDRPTLFGEWCLENVGERNLELLHMMSHIQWPALRLTVGEVKKTAVLDLEDVWLYYQIRKAS